MGFYWTSIVEFLCPCPGNIKNKKIHIWGHDFQEIRAKEVFNSLLIFIASHGHES